MRTGKACKKVQTLSFKLNMLIIAIILTVSVLLATVSNSAYREAVFGSVSRRLEQIEVMDAEFTGMYIGRFLEIFASEEFSEFRSTEDSAGRPNLAGDWMHSQPSLEGEYDNLYGDWSNSVSELARALWENNDLESVAIEAEKDGVTWQLDERISITSVDEISYGYTFGIPEAFHPDLRAEDYETPVQVRTGDQDLFMRCMRFGLEGGGEWRVWITYDMTDAVREYRNYRTAGILMILALTAAGSAVSILLMRRHITRPIRDLARSTRNFVPEEDGTYSAERIARVNTGSRDEIGDFSRDVRAMQERIVTDTENLARMTAERERIRTETDMARDIQLSMLPRVFPAFPERTEFSLHASMRPAREVGGDFYDFFLTDEDHLALVIGDVSGKGMPAALFMSLAKALIRNQLKTGCDPAQAMTRVNAQLCEQNEAMMFVTVWLAVLELSTGRGTACNAGHEHPALRRAGGEFELVRYKHDPMAGVRGTLQYRLREFELRPGDSLFVYTDGVTEANNAEKEMFGENRLTETLNRDPDAGPEELIHRMYGAADGFAAGAPQFDDITMLCLKYRGTAPQ